MYVWVKLGRGKGVDMKVEGLTPPQCVQLTLRSVALPLPGVKCWQQHRSCIHTVSLVCCLMLSKVQLTFRSAALEKHRVQIQSLKA